jgi:hypothetical protein
MIKKRIITRISSDLGYLMYIDVATEYYFLGLLIYKVVKDIK